MLSNMEAEVCSKLVLCCLGPNMLLLVTSDVTVASSYCQFEIQVMSSY